MTRLFMLGLIGSGFGLIVAWAVTIGSQHGRSVGRHLFVGGLCAVAWMVTVALLVGSVPSLAAALPLFVWASLGYVLTFVALGRSAPPLSIHLTLGAALAAAIGTWSTIRMLSLYPDNVGLIALGLPGLMHGMLVALTWVVSALVVRLEQT